MKISHIETSIVRLPADEPLANPAAPAAGTRNFVTVTVRTDDGLEGIGFSFFGWAITGALRTAIDELGALIIGDDPLRAETIAAKLRGAAGGAGPGGIFTLALSALDIALWDIKGKVANLPVSKLLGGSRDRVPTYASGALGRTLSLDQVAEAAATLVKKGFRQMKTQLALPGPPNPRGEVERIRAIRAAIGPDIDLMCDVNQRWSVHQAIDIGQRLEDTRLFWLEDVTRHDDYQGLACITDALSTPIAGGEYVYGLPAFRQMIEARSVDIVMVDVLRAGGITQWQKIAAMAEAFNMPVVSHCHPEVSIHLVAAFPHGLTVEYMPWLYRIFEEPLQIQDGQMLVPDRPGLGLTFNREALRRYSS
ncbi:L-talarate/galactarate dehydratase [Pigmentiphaga soli]|uniref:L-talarate/galactarate dehydratase n=1 Tax=Pigmentiphaga soli TaxID=1007095 RepID=A0ABP8H374_9BURK